MTRNHEPLTCQRPAPLWRRAGRWRRGFPWQRWEPCRCWRPPAADSALAVGRSHRMARRCRGTHHGGGDMFSGLQHSNNKCIEHQAYNLFRAANVKHVFHVGTFSTLHLLTNLLWHGVTSILAQPLHTLTQWKSQHDTNGFSLFLTTQLARVHLTTDQNCNKIHQSSQKKWTDQRIKVKAGINQIFMSVFWQPYTFLPSALGEKNKPTWTREKNANKPKAAA